MKGLADKEFVKVIHQREAEASLGGEPVLSKMAILTKVVRGELGKLLRESEG